jgi:hypothetical protein
MRAAEKNTYAYRKKISERGHSARKKHPEAFTKISSVC